MSEPARKQKSNSRPKPKPGKGNKRAKQKGRTIMQTPLQITSLANVQKRSTRAADGVLTDNFISAGDDQLLSCLNATQVSLQASQLIPDEEYANHTYATEDSRIHSIGWSKPTLYATGVSSIKIDSRGIIAQVKSASITFRNRSVTPITIRGNVPKSNVTTPEDIAYRTQLVRQTVAPGRSVTIPVKYKNTLNDAPHVNVFQNTNVGMVEYVRLFDFFVTYPKINQEANAEFDDKSKMVDVSVNVTFTASHTHNEENATHVEVDPFCLMNLQNYENVFLIDPPVIGPFSMHSRKNLTGGTKIQVGFFATTATAPENAALIAETDGKITPAFVYGQRTDDLLTLPVPVYIQGNRAVAKLTTASGYIFNDTGANATAYSGNIWLLQADNTLSGAALTVENGLDLSSARTTAPLVVGYSNQVSQSASARSRSKRDVGGTLEDSFGGPGDVTRNHRKRSLIAVISFLTAALKILGVVQEFRKKGKK